MASLDAAAEPAQAPAQTPARAPGSARRRPAGKGIDAATQARIDAGLMAGRLPWAVRIYLFCLVVPIWFNAGPLYMSTLRLYLLVMILPLTFQLLSGRFGRVILPDVLFFAHILWATVAITVSNPEKVVQQMGSVGIEFLGGYVLARAYIRKVEDFLALSRWLVVVVLCLTPFAIYEALTGRPTIIEAIRALPGILSIEIVTIDRRMGLERVQAVFAHPIHFGLFCSVAFSLAFVALKGVTASTWRWLSAAIVGATGFLALSSGALLAMVMQVGLIAWAALFDRIAWRWWLLLCLAAVAWVMIDLLSNRTPLQVFFSYATFSAHNAYWRGTIFEWGIANVLGSAEKGIAASPWVGIGLNDWIRPWYMRSGSMDNFWLVMAVRYGLPGFLFLALGYAWGLGRVMRRDLAADPVLSQIRRAWVFTFVGLTFTLSTVHVWASIYSFAFFMFGSGVWLLHARSVAPAIAAAQDVPGARGGVRSFSRFPVRPVRQPPLTNPPIRAELNPGVSLTLDKSWGQRQA